MSNLIPKSTQALETWKINFKAFSYIAIDHIVINCKCYRKGVFLSFSLMPLKQKWTTTALILKYKHLIHNRFQIVSPALNTFRFLNFYTGKPWCQPSHGKQARSDTFLFSEHLLLLLLFTKIFCWNGMVKKSEAFDNIYIYTLYTLKVYLLTFNISQLHWHMKLLKANPK